MHRIWAIIDRKSYASFWIGIMENKGPLYFLLMGILAGLCIVGIINFIWRWIYLFGGTYVLFDLFAIAVGLEGWQKLLAIMFDTNSPYWNFIWGFFIALGTAVFALGIFLMVKSKKDRT